MMELADFQHERGPSYARPSIFLSPLIDKGQIYLWHALYSVPFTEVFGRLARRVSSKLISAGGAERNWSALDHVWRKSRNALDVDRAEKQTFVYQHEQMLQSNMQSISFCNLEKQWSLEPEEFDVDIGLEKFGVEILAPEVMLIFNAYGEAWEAEAIKDHTEMGQFPLVEKYAGLRFYDSDARENYEILGEKCQWQNRRGWYVRARIADTNDDEEPENYAINQQLWDMIIASAHLNPTRNIRSEAPPE